MKRKEGRHHEVTFEGLTKRGEERGKPTETREEEGKGGAGGREGNIISCVL